MAGTIYIRDNQWFSQLGLYKLGKASCAKDRSSTYLTSEPIPGKYVMVVEVGDKMDIVDKLMKNISRHIKNILVEGQNITIDALNNYWNHLSNHLILNTTFYQNRKLTQWKERNDSTREKNNSKKIKIIW